MIEYRMKFQWHGSHEELLEIFKPLTDAIEQQAQEPPVIEVRTGDVIITPNYGSVSAIRDICEPWVECWSGDEWGEVIGSLLNAVTVDHGMSDEDIAVLAKVLWKNVDEMHDWATSEEGRNYYDDSDLVDVAAAKARAARDRWLEDSWEPTQKAAKETLDSLPAWVFEGAKPDDTSEVRSCGCGHAMKDCRPENCSHPFAAAALYGD